MQKSGDLLSLVLFIFMTMKDLLKASAPPAPIFIVVIKLLQSLRLCVSELLHWNHNGGRTGLRGRRLPLLALETNVGLSETRWEEPVFEEVIRKRE